MSVLPNDRSKFATEMRESSGLSLESPNVPSGSIPSKLQEHLMAAAGGEQMAAALDTAGRVGYNPNSMQTDTPAGTSATNNGTTYAAADQPSYSPVGGNSGSGGGTGGTVNDMGNYDGSGFAQSQEPLVHINGQTNVGGGGGGGNANGGGNGGDGEKGLLQNIFGCFSMDNCCPCCA